MKSGLDIATGLDKLENEFPESLKGYTGLQSAFYNLPEFGDYPDVVGFYHPVGELDLKEINLQRLSLLPDLAMALAVTIDTSTDILDGFINHPKWLNAHSTKDMIRNVNEIIYNNITRVTTTLANPNPLFWTNLYHSVEYMLNQQPTWEAWEAVLQIIINERGFIQN